jgi:hypothetical protein
MAGAHGLQKVHVLNFRSYIPDIPGRCSLHYSPTLQTFASPKHTRRAHFLCSYGCRIGGGRVDDLEGKILGERLGNCGKPYVSSDFPEAIHYSRESHVGSLLGRVIYRSTRTGFFRLARLNLSILPRVTRKPLTNAFTGAKDATYVC